MVVGSGDPALPVDGVMLSLKKHNQPVFGSFPRQCCGAIVLTKMKDYAMPRWRRCHFCQSRQKQGVGTAGLFVLSIFSTPLLVLHSSSLEDAVKQNARVWHV